METTDGREVIAVSDDKLDSLANIFTTKLDGLKQVNDARFAEEQRTNERIEKTVSKTATEVSAIKQKVDIDHEHMTGIDRQLAAHRNDIGTLFARTKSLDVWQKQVSTNTHDIIGIKKRRVFMDVLLPIGFVASTLIAIFEAIKLFGF